MHASQRLIWVLILLVISAPLWAQDSTRYGIGVSLGDLFKKYDFADLYEEELYDRLPFPVLYGSILTSHFRLDPELSIWRYDNNQSSSGYSNDKSSTVFHIGLGVAPYIKRGTKSVTYAGGKISLDRLSSKTGYSYEYGTGNETKTTRTDINLGAYIGSEYFLTHELSLGGEFQLLYTMVGNLKQESSMNEGNNDNDEDTSFFKSKALVYLRWYF